MILLPLQWASTCRRKGQLAALSLKSLLHTGNLQSSSEGGDVDKELDSCTRWLSISQSVSFQASGTDSSSLCYGLLEKPPGRWGISHGSLRKAFFLLLSRPSLWSAVWESKGCKGEVSIIFDLMAPLLLGYSLGKKNKIPPWEGNIYHGRGSVCGSAGEDAEHAWRALDILTQIRQSNFIQVNT